MHSSHINVCLKWIFQICYAEMRLKFKRRWDFDARIRWLHSFRTRLPSSIFLQELYLKKWQWCLERGQCSHFKKKLVYHLDLTSFSYIFMFHFLYLEQLRVVVPLLFVHKLLCFIIILTEFFIFYGVYLRLSS